MYRTRSKRKLNFAALVVVSAILLAVGGAAAAEKPGPLKITMAGYSVGGASAVVGEALGEAIKRTVPGSAFTYEPGKSGANEVTVSTGKTEVGLSHVWTTKLAMGGQAFYQGKKYPNLRAITYLHDTTACALFRKDAGLTSFEQIKEKKFPLVAGFNTKNSLMEHLGRYTLNAYGITYEEIEQWGGKIHYLSSRPTFDLIRNKRAHAFLSAITPPYGAINELATTVDLIWLPMSDKAIQYVGEKMGGGKKVMTKKEDYTSFMKEDVPTVAVPNILITSAETPEDVVYWVIKAIYNNLDYVRRTAKQLTLMTKETMAKEIGGLPLHPGAEKFYKEVGIL